jgi:Carboxypeptidase regulatory-like domain/TonB dependent receptor-like, beta-barrel/TonB-dependent Receptor Plug Domain
MKILKSALILILLLLAGKAWAVGEQTGRIEGNITEAQSGAPVPGATVSVNGKSLIGGPRTQLTDDTGHYEVVGLPPGSFDLEVSYAGVKPLKRRVVVRQGETLPLDIQWSPELSEAEVTVIVEERHMTKPDSTQTGTVITLDTSSKVATQRDYQDIALQVAGTVDVNGFGNPQIKGGNLMMNRYLVDGLDITDPVVNTFSANINFDSISSIEVLTGGMEAQYNTLGGIINLITAGGSDEWHVDASLYIGNNKFSAGGQFGSQLYQGAVPLSRVTPGATQSYQANVNVGGPIIKHRLWFNVSLEYDFTEFSVPAGPPLNLQPPPRRYNGVEARLKLTWAPNEKHRVTLSISGDPAFLSNLDTADSNYRLPIAQDYQEQGGAFAILQWDWFINQNTNFNLQTGFLYNHLFTGPQGYFTGIDHVPGENKFSAANQSYDFNRPQHNNLDDGTIWYQGSFLGAVVHDNRYRFQFDPSISLRGRGAGTHDAKIGLQLQYIKSTYDVNWAGKGVGYYDSGGGPGESGLCDETTGTGGCFLKITNADYSQHYEGTSVGVYLQDRWKPVKRLTILPGIRFDYGTTSDSVGRTAYNLFGVGPRLGVLVDLTGDQKTIFSAFYGRANDVQNLLPAAYGSPTPLSQTLLWDGTAFSRLVGASGGDQGYYYDKSATTPPHTDEFTASIRREVFKNSVAAVDYTYKHIANMWDWIEVNRVWDPTGFRQATDTNGNPIYVNPSLPQSIYKITTNHNAVREYQGVDFTIESRPTDNWDLYFAYTLSWLYGSAGEQFSGQVNGTNGPFFNPRQTHLWDGFLPEDVRHILKLRVSYNWKGLNAGFFFTYQTGAPVSREYFQFTDGNYVNLRGPTGTDPGGNPNNPRGFAELRLPDLMQLDLRASYDFHALIRQHIVLIVDFFNLFNLRATNGIENRDLPTFGQVTSRQQPFRFQLALRYMY